MVFLGGISAFVELCLTFVEQCLKLRACCASGGRHVLGACAFRGGSGVCAQPEGRAHRRAGGNFPRTKINKIKENVNFVVSGGIMPVRLVLTRGAL